MQHANKHGQPAVHTMHAQHQHVLVMSGVGCDDNAGEQVDQRRYWSLAPRECVNHGHDLALINKIAH